MAVYGVRWKISTWVDLVEIGRLIFNINSHDKAVSGLIGTAPDVTIIFIDSNNLKYACGFPKF